jgi:hypothetical protein
VSRRTWRLEAELEWHWLGFPPLYWQGFRAGLVVALALVILLGLGYLVAAR